MSTSNNTHQIPTIRTTSGTQHLNRGRTVTSNSNAALLTARIQRLEGTVLRLQKKAEASRSSVRSSGQKVPKDLYKTGLVQKAYDAFVQQKGFAFNFSISLDKDTNMLIKNFIIAKITEDERRITSNDNLVIDAKDISERIRRHFEDNRSVHQRKATLTDQQLAEQSHSKKIKGRLAWKCKRRKQVHGEKKKRLALQFGMIEKDWNHLLRKEYMSEEDDDRVEEEIVFTRKRKIPSWRTEHLNEFYHELDKCKDFSKKGKRTPVSDVVVDIPMDLNVLASLPRWSVKPEAFSRR